MLTTLDALKNRPGSPGDEAVVLLAKATELFAHGLDYEATLQSVVSLLVSSLACWCTIDLLTDEGKIERIGAAHRDPAKAESIRKILVNYPARPSATRGVYRVIETGKSILIPHIAIEEWAKRAEDSEHLRIIFELGSTSYMCVPLIARGRTVGSIMLLSGERSYAESDLQTAERLAQCIAMAVDNVQMFHKTQATLRSLRSTQEQLVQKEKLVALCTMAAGVAHEINNPLTVIQAHTEAVARLLKSAGSESKARCGELMDRIKRSVDRVAHVVQGVRNFSQQSNLRKSKVSLRSLLQASWNYSGDQSRSSQIDFQLKMACGDLKVFVDSARLEQVFIHVFRNSRDAINAKASAQGGCVECEVTHVPGAVRITVSDNGIGIDQSVSHRVFEPFFTTKDVGCGTGLGLSIAYGIVQSHDGSISFSSERGSGTKVQIELPQVR